jgi:hypothetical protein
MNKTVVINFYGGPGTGKSTIAARIFSELKVKGIECELITEFAKRKVWEGNTTCLENQLYISSKQIYSMFTVAKHVDVIVTDSPIILGVIYGNDDLLEPIIIREHNKYENLDFFLTRTTPYDPVGRVQDESTAYLLDKKIENLLIRQSSSYTKLPADNKSIQQILDIIDSKLNQSI